jgi:hypothetical protein
VRQTVGVQTRRWLNPSQPQTLQIAIFLLYIHAVFGFLDLLQYRNAVHLPASYLLDFALRIVGGVLAGRGIANERKWGYGLGLAVAVAPFAFRYWQVQNPFNANIITLAFEIALVALLLHTQSREYQRVWFK